MKFNLNNSAFQKALGVVSVVFAGVVAVSNALSEQKKEAEFEEMKKTISELKSK